MLALSLAGLVYGSCRLEVEVDILFEVLLVIWYRRGLQSPARHTETTHQHNGVLRTMLLVRRNPMLLSLSLVTLGGVHACSGILRRRNVTPPSLACVVAA